MTRKEYISFTKELVANGYQFRKNCPFKGRNKWIKRPQVELDSSLEMDVYTHIDNSGEYVYNLKPWAVIKQNDNNGCNVRLTIDFHMLNIADIEQVFIKYVEKFK